MDALSRIFNSTGAERRAWLTRQERALGDTLSYYLGPAAQPLHGLARAVGEFSDAADFRDAYEYGGRAGDALSRGQYWQAVQDAAQSAAATGAIAIPGVSAAALRGGVSKADEIARLLREGRADEVTDDMLGALTPQDEARLFELYEQGATGMHLPMDAVSRAARAEAMGFGTEAYHGKPYGDPVAFKDELIGGNSDGGFYGRGHYTATTPEEASYYGSTILPLTERGKALDLNNDTGDLTYRGHFKSFAPKLQEIDALQEDQARALKAILDADAHVDQNVKFLKAVGRNGDEGWIAQVESPLHGPGYSSDPISTGMDFRGVPYKTKEDALDALRHKFSDEMQYWHPGSYPGLGDEHASLSDYVRTQLGASVLTEKARAAGYDAISYGDERVNFDPRNIRSRFARFDPRLAHLRNLSAAGLGVAAGGGALRDYVYDDEGNPQPGGAQ